MQEWLSEEISNEPSKPRNASCCQHDAITMSRVGDQLGDWSGGNPKDYPNEILSKPNSDFGMDQHQCQASSKTDTKFQANNGLQLTHGLTGDGFGSGEAHGKLVIQRGPDKGGYKAVRMDFEGGSEGGTSV